MVCLSQCPIHLRKRGGGVQKSMGHKVPWKTGMLIYLPVTERPLIVLQKEAVLPPCNFATAHLTTCILNCYLPLTSRPMKWRTLSQRPKCPIHHRKSSMSCNSGKISRNFPAEFPREPPKSFWKQPRPSRVFLLLDLKRCATSSEVTAIIL